MEGMLKPVEAPLVEALRLDRACRIADVACGGGGTTLEIARRAPEGSVVHGFDISPSLVERARERAKTEPRPIVFETANVATWKPETPYDRLCSRFGIMFFDAPEEAFANLASWLSPEGRFAFAAWGSPSGNPWMTEVRDVVASIVEVPPFDTEAPGMFRYGDADKLTTLLENAGFGAIDVQSWRGALPIGGGLSVDDAASFVLAALSSFGDLLSQAGDEALAHARRDVANLFEKHRVDGVVRMDAHVHVFTGSVGR